MRRRMDTRHLSGWRVALVILTLATASVVIAEASNDGFVDPSDEVPETNPQQLEQSWEEETPAHGTELLDAEPSTHTNTPVNVKDEIKRAATAVAKAKELLVLDKSKAGALIDKAESTGRESDKIAATLAVHEAQRIQQKLQVSKDALERATQEMAALPMSAAVRAKEDAEKQHQKRKQLAKSEERKQKQADFSKKYGVRSTCHQECSNEKVCLKQKCHDKKQKVCLKAGPEQCFHKRQCVKYTTKCARVKACLKRASMQCEYPRKCVERAQVCGVQDVCTKKTSHCDKTFSNTCIACATKVESCKQARRTSEDCIPACKAKCKGASTCMTQCRDGCKKMYDGFLSACKKICSTCEPKSTCTSKCLKREPKQVCTSQCSKWKILDKRTCKSKCLKPGMALRCNTQFCAKYVPAPKVCKSDCIKRGEKSVGQDCKCQSYSKVATEKCKQKCSHVKCVPDCKPTFHQNCAERGPMRCHRPKKCAVATIRRCENKRQCSKHGAQICKHKSECIAYKNECKMGPKCTEHVTTCADDFSADCVTCAAKSTACLQARKTSETCMLSCESHCKGNETCLIKCKEGCSTIQNGFLASCKQDCPTCAKKSRVCQTTCKKTEQVNTCKNVCAKERETKEMHCYKPCTEYGIFQHCDDHFCPKYTLGSKICDKPCVRYKASASKWCKPKCEEVKCKELCGYKPVQKCSKKTESCKKTACAKRGVRCRPIDTCLIPGQKSCVHKDQCLLPVNKCKSVPVCDKQVSTCHTDTSKCDACKRKAAPCGDQIHGTTACAQSCKTKCGSDPICGANCADGCKTISDGFARACKAACPMCLKPTEVCTEECVKKSFRTECAEECSKSLSLSKSCTAGPCRSMSRSTKCDENACLEEKSVPPVCNDKCIEYTTHLQKVCATDCSKNPSVTFDAYATLTNATSKNQQRIDTCTQSCYKGSISCHADKLASCTKDFQGQVLSCIDACQAAPHSPTKAEIFTTCMSKCDDYHPFEKMQKCKDERCTSLAGVDLFNCKKQCYEPRGRCRCACNSNKEYVCRGMSCSCATIPNSASGQGAREAARTVAAAAEYSAKAISDDPPSKNVNEGIGARSVAANVAHVAAKYEVGGEEAAKEHAQILSASEKGEELAVKKAAKVKQKLMRLMKKGATAAAFSVAQNTTGQGSLTQHEVSLLAATAAAKRASASLVKTFVKSAAHAAAKAARAAAIKSYNPPEKQRAAVVSAVKNAVKVIMKPVREMITTTAEEATKSAILKYPAHCESTLCYKKITLANAARARIHDAAASAAHTTITSITVKGQHQADILARVKKAANAAIHPIVVTEVKELTAKAAAQSQVVSTKQKVTEEIAKAAAKSAANGVAKDALRISKDIVNAVAKAAMTKKAKGNAAAKLSSKKGNMEEEDMALITKEAIASDVKDALDHQGHTEGAGAKAEEASSKAAAKRAILDQVHRASNAASKEAAAKGETKSGQAAAANSAASKTIMMGRDVQKVVKGITMKARDEPEVKVHIEAVKGVVPDGESMVNKSSDTSTTVEVNLHGNSTTGQQVLEAIQSRGGKTKNSPAKVSHLQALIQNAAQDAAERAVHKMAKLDLIVSSGAAKKAAYKAAKAAAKKTVLIEVHKMATSAAKSAKKAVKAKGMDFKAQSSAASKAASQAAKHVLTIAKKLQHDVVRDAASKGLRQMKQKLSIRAKQAAEGDHETK